MLSCVLSISFIFFLLQVTLPLGAAPTENIGGATASGVKAAFLYKFLGYVEWPPTSAGQSNSPITIGVIGADDVAAELSEIARGRTVNDRSLAVRQLREGDPLTGIQVLFIGRTDGVRLDQLLKMAQQRAILSVTETDGALAQGSVINFMPVDSRIRFEVSLEAAEKSNLKLSSRMLSVAHRVQKGAQ